METNYDYTETLFCWNCNRAIKTVSVGEPKRLCDDCMNHLVEDISKAETDIESHNNLTREFVDIILAALPFTSRKNNV